MKKRKMLICIFLACLLMLMGVSGCDDLTDEPSETGTQSTVGTDPDSTTDTQGTTAATDPSAGESTDVTNPGENDPTDSSDPVATDPSKPSDPTQPSTDSKEPVDADPTQPTVDANDPVETEPSDPTEPTEADPAEPTDPEETAPTQPATPAEPLTYEEYVAMTPEERKAYSESFASFAEFGAWYNAAKAAYEANQDHIDTDGGDIDIGDIIGGKRE